MNRGALLVVAAISGGCVLAIEILGTRILGPFYGVSLYLWSALISVTLAALSVGYWFGGRWADRDPHPRHLATLLGGAGVWILLVPVLRTPLLALTEAWGLRAAVLTTSTVLFFPPLVLLGMVSPFIIRVRTLSVSEVGRTAGDLFAISTVASVAAALATGFWLIPALGVVRLTLGIGAVLVATGVAVLLATRASRVAAAGLVVLALAGSVLGARAAAPAGRGLQGLRLVTDSPYAEIRVLDRRGLRYFLIDGGVHTIVLPKTWESHHSYVPVAELAHEAFARPGRMLLIGLGGGSLAKSYARNGWQVDAVEIDPVVIRVAREHFGLAPEDAAVTTMDGRRFLERSRDRYDLIFFDAFGSSSIPFHLVTREVFALAKSRLAPGGVVGLNIEAVGWKDELVRRMMATLRTSFAHAIALPIAEPPDHLGNLVLLASDRRVEIPDESVGDPVATLDDDQKHWHVLQRMHAWDNRFEVAARAGDVYTDDLNPVDVRAEEINRVARRELHEFFGAKGGSW